MPIYTTHYNLAKPDVNNPDDQDLWGGYLNGDMDIIDTTLYAIQQGMYPVGAIYIETTGVNPATTFGFGTWVAYAAGRVLVGVGTGTDSNGQTGGFSPGEIYGEYIHTLTTPEMPSHTHTDSGHTHQYIPGSPDGASGGGPNYNTHGGSSTVATGAGYANLANTGGGVPHNNIQPVIAVYIWQRTA